MSMAMRMRRDPPVPRLCSCAMADEPPRLPDAPGGYGPSGRSPWLDVDWREHQRWVTIDGGRVNVIELGSGPPVVFIHGLSGSWQNWLEQLPVFARDHRVIAFDLPGFGASQMPREKITIRGYGPFVDALLDELGVSSAAVVGNSMGGFIGIELAIRFPERVERLVLVSAAGLSIEYLRNERALAVLSAIENRLAAYSGWLASRSDALARRPGARRMIFGIVAKRPDRLPGPARRRAGPRLGQAGLPARPRRAHGLPDPRPTGRDRLPDAHRLGRRGQARPRTRRRRVRAPDPQLAQGRVARDRSRGDARAPGGLQCPRAGVPGRGAGRARRRVGRGRRGVVARRACAQRTVTAPSEALPTSAAYLARTPVRSAFGGAS